MRHYILAAAAAALTLSAAPAMADPPDWAPAHGKRAKDRAADRQTIYDAHGRYYKPRRVTRSTKVWRGDDGRYYCKRDNGTTGLIIGAGLGALAGHELAGRGDKTLGVILGAAVGGLLGREIDKGSLNCR